MTEIFAQPDDIGPPRASELEAGLGQSLGAQAHESLMAGANLIGRNLQYYAAEHGWEAFLRGAASQNPAIHPDAPDVAIDAARKRVADEGLEGELKLPEQPTIRGPVLDLMIHAAHERRDYNAAVSRGPQGFAPGALGFATQIGAGMLDPVNLLAFSVPVMGEARMGQLMARGGNGILARTGVRAGIGAAQGAAGAALLQPADWWLHTQDGQDWTYRDALRAIGMGAAMGGTMHAGLGAFGDLMARVRGLPLEGSPEALTLEGLRGAAERSPPPERGAVPSTRGRTTIDINGERVLDTGAPEVPEAGAAVHPAEIFDDLPPAAREDLVRAAAADILEDRPGRAGEVLAIAADQDPRIAESARPGAAGPALVVARRMPDGSVKYGQPGDVHTDLMSRRELDADGPTPPEIDAAMGFAQTGGPFMTRQEALAFARQHEPERAAFSAEQPENGLEAASYGDRRAAPVLPGPKPAKGPRARADRTFSLFEFLSQRGGIAPHPDVASMFGGKNPFVPGFGRLIRKTGMSLDRAREAAVEAGYLHDPAQQHGGVTESTVNHLLDAMDAEARGNRVYRAGEERAKGPDRDEELHHINREIDAVFTENGLDPRSLPDKTRARVVEMMDREGVSNPLEAYERALLEEDRRGTDEGQHPADAPIRGWDVPENAGGAPGEGRPSARGEPGAGEAARRAGADDGGAAGRPDAAWRRLAEQRDPDADAELAASKAAEAAPELGSVDPAKTVSEAEAKAAEADAILKDMPLTEAERATIDEALAQLETDKATQEQILRDGAACLLEAIA